MANVMRGESRGHSSEKRGQGHTKAWEALLQKAEEDKYGKAIKDPQGTLKKMYDKIMGPQLANLQKKGVLNVDEKTQFVSGADPVKKKEKKENKDKKKDKKKSKKDKKKLMKKDKKKKSSSSDSSDSSDSDSSSSNSSSKKKKKKKKKKNKKEKKDAEKTEKAEGEESKEPATEEAKKEEEKEKKEEAEKKAETKEDEGAQGGNAYIVDLEDEDDVEDKKENEKEKETQKEEEKEKDSKLAPEKEKEASVGDADKAAGEAGDSRRGSGRKRKNFPGKGGPGDEREKRDWDKGSSQTLRLGRRGLKDSDLDKVLDDHPGDDLNYGEIDLSRNNISSEGMSQVVQLCRRCPGLRILKLFNNCIDDKGFEELADIFNYCQEIEEIHLSHNKMTREGAEALVNGAEKELPKEANRPLWLRVEHNDIKDPEEFIRGLESTYDSVCGCEDRRRCFAQVCAKGCRIHVPFLIERSKGKGKGKGKRSRSRDWNKGGRRWGDRGRSPDRRPQWNPPPADLESQSRTPPRRQQAASWAPTFGGPIRDRDQRDRSPPRPSRLISPRNSRPPPPYSRDSGRRPSPVRSYGKGNNYDWHNPNDYDRRDSFDRRGAGRDGPYNRGSYGGPPARLAPGGGGRGGPPGRPAPGGARGGYDDESEWTEEYSYEYEEYEDYSPEPGYGRYMSARPLLMR